MPEQIIDAPSPWLTRDEVATRLRVPKSTVESWAVKGAGPRFAKFGRHVRYRLSDVVRWEEDQLGGVE
jgi:excisionase family DNA binding protein